MPRWSRTTIPPSRREDHGPDIVLEGDLELGFASGDRVEAIDGGLAQVEPIELALLLLPERAFAQNAADLQDAFDLRHPGPPCCPPVSRQAAPDLIPSGAERQSFGQQSSCPGGGCGPMLSAMSRAFIKEDDSNVSGEELPERPAKPAPELCHPGGLGRLAGAAGRVAGAAAPADGASRCDPRPGASEARGARYPLFPGADRAGGRHRSGRTSRATR